ncbi:MAG TPA: 23S rRNA (pseudouridine(1915)-N(3))-methyltransferase RlmH [Patescibacteria group bacterium]|nr:23S rRNA (pseudouridine(1915)-N(3))-methyltransferase RlmH [Patescibacteria group bacterium]
MFKFTIITLGKFKEKAYLELEKVYMKRLKGFSKISLVELPEVPYKTEAQKEQAKVLEAEKIIRNIPEGSIVILLDEKGSQKTSKDLSMFIERLGSFGEQITFVIGSGAGLHPNLKGYSNYQISLSLLTFPHNLARLMLVEQLYRCLTIIKGIEYHK